MVANASFDATFLNIPIRALYISGEVLPVVVREVTSTRSFGVHDSVKMSVLIDGELTFDGKVRIPLDVSTPDSGTRVVATESLVGQPVSFGYGVSPQTDQFYGYIMAVTPDQQFKQGLNYVISMTGSTLIMQQEFRRFYVNLTDSEITQRLVDRAQLGFISTSTSTYRWPSTGISGNTDWELANALASRSGCLLFNWGGVVRMNEAKALFREFPFTTLVSSDDLLETDRKLLDFKPTEMAVNQAATRPMEFFFFDNGGNVVSFQQTKAGYQGPLMPFSLAPVASRQEAEQLGMATENSIDRWLQAATARIRGDASIYPGVTVDVNTGTKTSTAKFNGRWLVVAVSHSMKRDAFNTELTLARPGDTIPAMNKTSFDHFWRTTDRGRPQLVLRDNRWFSSWANPYSEVAV